MVASFMLGFMFSMSALSAGAGEAQRAAAVAPAAVGQDGRANTPQVAMAHQSGGSSRRRRKPPPYEATTVTESGTIEGVVLYRGTVPPPRQVQIVKDHATCDKHPKEVPVLSVDAQQRVAEAVVFLADIRRGRDFDANGPKAVIDQSTCSFHPHVQAIRIKAPVEIVNNDPVAHNIQANQGVFTLFNILQPQQGMKAEKSFERAGLVEIKCNVHEWMSGFVYVFTHPYNQVTAADGAFKLERVPPGKYELAVWQEHLGEQVFPVEVKNGETTKIEIELKPKT